MIHLSQLEHDALKGSAPAEPRHSEEQLIAADLHYKTFSPRDVEECKRLLSDMTLRDHFAAQALQGLMLASCSDDDCAELVVDTQYSRAKQCAKQFATGAYAVADAMLEARK